MLGYILRRLLIALGTVWVISMIAFAIIQLPPGDYVTSYIAQLMATGTLVTQEEAENLRIQYGSAPTPVRPIRQVGMAHAAGQFRRFDGMAAAGAGGDRRSSSADRPTGLRGGHFHLDSGHPDRHLLGGAAVLRRGLHFYVHWLHWPCGAQLSVGPGGDVPVVCLFRRQYRRPVLNGIPRRAVELGPRVGPVQALVDSGADSRYRRHSPTGAHPACQSAWTSCASPMS